ncbi:hypothetical protein GCM10022397_47140 [Flavivirga jejuensis]
MIFVKCLKYKFSIFLFDESKSLIGFPFSSQIAIYKIRMRILKKLDRRNHRKSISDKIIERCVAHKLMTFCEIKINEI